VTKQLKIEVIANTTVCKLVIHEGVLAQESTLDRALTGLRPADQIAVLRQMVMAFTGVLEGLSEADVEFATNLRAEARKQLVGLSALAGSVS
jgi:hypothetical protein